MLKNLEFVIPNGVCEAQVLRPVRFVGVRNLSFLDILIEEGFIAQKHAMENRTSLRSE
jgi:hypothetical protein